MKTIRADSWHADIHNEEVWCMDVEFCCPHCGDSNEILSYAARGDSGTHEIRNGDHTLEVNCRECGKKTAVICDTANMV